MTVGVRTWDAAGRMTFDGEMSLARQEVVITIPAHSSGSIDLSPYLGGSAAVRFIPADSYTQSSGVAPYTTWNSSVLSWQADIGTFLLAVVGFVR